MIRASTAHADGEGFWITTARPLECVACGSVDILALCPGTEDERLLGIVVRRGVAVRAWCPVHWHERFGNAEARQTCP